MQSIFLTIFLALVNFHHDCDANSSNTYNSKPCKVLPNGCNLKLVYKNRVHSYNVERFIYCQRLDERFDFDYEKFIKKENCSRAKGTNKIYFRLSKPRVLDDSLDFVNLRRFLDQLVEFYSYEFTFKNLLGFDAQYFNNPIDDKYAFTLKIYSSPLNFYLNRTLINSCLTNNYSSGSIFHALPLRATVMFFQIKSSVPICPLLFRNMRFSTLELRGLVETFYKTNVPRFINMSINSSNSFRIDAGSKIRWLSLNDFTLVRLDNSVLNNIVFGQIADLSLLGEFESIEPGLLRSFNRLISVNFIASLFSKHCRHRGVDWLTDLNYETRYNLSDSDFWQNQDAINNLKSVTINLDFMDAKKDKHISLGIMLSPWYFFPDEDFCVYQRFPFDQLLVLDFNFVIPIANISCTYAWLIQYYQIYRRFVLSYMFIAEKYVQQLEATIQKCDFKKR